MRLLESVEEARVEERLEGFSEAGGFDVVVDDEEPLEQRLVPHPADLRTGFPVGRVGVDGEVERLVEDRLDFAVGVFGLGEVLFGLCHFCGEGVLLFLEEVDGHGVGEVGIEERFALGLEAPEAAALTPGFRLAFGSHAGDRFGELLPDFFDVAGPLVGVQIVPGGEVHQVVALLDLSFDVGDRAVLLPATGAPAPGDAEEVGVARAGVGAGVDEAHP